VVSSSNLLCELVDYLAVWFRNRGGLGGNELLDKQLPQRSMICFAFPGGGWVSKAVSRVISLLLSEGLYYSCRHKSYDRVIIIVNIFVMLLAKAAFSIAVPATLCYGLMERGNPWGVFMYSQRSKLRNNNEPFSFFCNGSPEGECRATVFVVGVVCTFASVVREAPTNVTANENEIIKIHHVCGSWRVKPLQVGTISTLFLFVIIIIIIINLFLPVGREVATRWRNRLRLCATSRKVAGSISDRVIRILTWICLTRGYCI
jgi:hypothetical protein